MTTQIPDRTTFIADADAAVRSLHQFGVITGPPAPKHHGYLGTVTNSAMAFLGLCVTCIGCKVHWPEVTDDQWQQIVAAAHRGFYASLVLATEGVCDGFCEARGSSVKSSKPPRQPEFLDYVNSALAICKMSEHRKTYWRKHFDAVRIMRNKASHFRNILTKQEKQILIEAGLQNHIDPNDGIQTKPTFYAPLAQSVLDFIHEIDATSA